MGEVKEAHTPMNVKDPPGGEGKVGEMRRTGRRRRREREEKIKEKKKTWRKQCSRKRRR